jgi:hypothetical protein
LFEVPVPGKVTAAVVMESGLTVEVTVGFCVVEIVTTTETPAGADVTPV